jgi:hypothetical protein
VIVGTALKEGDDSKSRQQEMAGIVPISGLQNTYDADYDPLTNDLFHLEHGSTSRLLTATLVSDSRIYKSKFSITFLKIIWYY